MTIKFLPSDVPAPGSTAWMIAGLGAVVIALGRLAQPYLSAALKSQEKRAHLFEEELRTQIDDLTARNKALECQLQQRDTTIRADGQAFAARLEKLTSEHTKELMELGALRERIRHSDKVADKLRQDHAAQVADLEMQLDAFRERQQPKGL